MKRKPVKPKRKSKVQRYYSMEDDEYLKETLDWAKKYNINPKNIKINVEYVYLYSSSLYAIGYSPETDVEFKLRMVSYKKSLAKWNKQKK